MSDEAASDEEAKAGDEGEPVGEAVPQGDAVAEAGGDGRSVLDSLDLERGEVDDADVGSLEDAVFAIDFATRRVSEERLERIVALHAKLGDLIEQLRRGERTQAADAAPLTAEQEARYKSLVDQGVEAGERRDLDEAQQHLEQAVRLNPDGLEGLFNLGVVYGLLAHFNIAKAEFYDDYTRDEIFLEKARICYDRVLDAEPNHLASLNNLATLYSMREDRPTAIGYLERLVAIEPQDDDEKAMIAAAQEQLEELRSF
ncbi:MAG: tetratricopeptide repeat protein [Planctomycetota bacterium]